MNVKVSVLVITYNQERFIKEALDSILNQKVDFSYEVIVAEDCSPDGTRRILQEYEKNYSNIIKPIYREKNLGMIENLLDALTYCKGKYVAFLEGDDYWTNQKKLQKQVDFLDNNPEYLMVAHECSMVGTNGELIEEVCNVHTTGLEEFTMENVQEFELPGQTLTLMVSNMQGLLREFIENKKVGKAMPLDRLLAIGVLSKGKIRILPEVMGAYRFYIEANGTNWSSKYDKRSDKCNFLIHFIIIKKMEWFGRRIHHPADMDKEKVKLFYETWDRKKSSGCKRYWFQCIAMILLEFHKMKYIKEILNEHSRRKNTDR